MKLKRFLSFLFALALLVSFTSCDKDDDPATNTDPTRMDLLTAGTWTGVAMYSEGEDVTLKNIETQQYDFRKQLWKYEKDGNYLSTYERKSLSGKWEFVDGEQAILHDKAGHDELTTRITKLTDKELYLEYLHKNKTIEERYTR